MHASLNACWRWCWCWGDGLYVGGWSHDEGRWLTAMAVAVVFTSERVGCAWQVRAMSSDEAPYSMPSTASAIISPRGVALGFGVGREFGFKI